MKTPTCGVASNERIAMADEARARLHSQCGRALVEEETGKVLACTCACHEQQAGSTLQNTEALPVVSSAVSEPPPQAARLDRPAPARAPGGGSTCECGCGTGTGGKFAPGHDAKLKSRLVIAARAGDDLAYAELVLRNWAHLASRVPADVIKSGTAWAAEEGYGLVVDRVEARRRGS